MKNLNELEMKIKSGIIGSVEMKKSIKYNPLKGFFSSQAFVGLLLFGAIFSGVLYQAEVSKINNPVSVTELGNWIDNLKNKNISEPIITDLTNDLPAGGAMRSQFLAGDPTPVPDAAIQDLKNEYANFDNIVSSISNDKGAIVDGTKLDGLTDNDLKLNKSAKVGEGAPAGIKINDEPDKETYFDYQKEPAVDLKVLQSNVEYPKVAVNAGIEGTVLVSVLLSENGSVLKINIEKSTSYVLNKAAIDAVKKTSFSPAIYNERAVKSWLTIPIVFKLK
jgi:TonB family protein